MKTRYLLLLIMTLLTFKTTAAERRKADEADTIHEVMLLRQEVSRFFAAPDRAAALDAADQVKDHWQRMPDEMRARIEREHPGTNYRFLSLASEVAAAPAPAQKPAKPVADKPPVPQPPPAENEAADPEDNVLNPDGQPPEDPTPEPMAPASSTKPAPRPVQPDIVRYADEFDVFGNRPVSTHKR